VAKLRATPDGDGTLLDHSAILYGGALSDGNAHSNVNLPLLLAGQTGAERIGGAHIKLPKPTPVANLFLNLMDSAGLNTENFADSTGRLNLLA
jgi:hypothetical protein